MENVPLYIPLVFGFTTILTIVLFWKAIRFHKATIAVLTLWIALQCWLGLSGFYTYTGSVPPRFLFLILPPVILIVALFSVPTGRRYIEKFNLKDLTLVHIIRIPVEMVLYWLFICRYIPQLMTFEGINFDILLGLTAPVIYFLAFRGGRIHAPVLLAWNCICLVLLIIIVFTAVFSAPFPFQQFAFEQPNTAILYFPFNWLPSCVVPVVLFSHLIVIRQLLINRHGD